MVVPVSNGFGRRLRYLVWDRGNDKLMGIVAIGDPVFNLKARDDLFTWGVDDRAERLVNVLDAYVLGAIPPYNMILGGKLVSCLIRSREVRDDFKKRYGQSRGIISGKKKNAQLVVVTTSSSLGRSSVYNRLKLGGQSYFRSIGFTQGWGHFHVPDPLFAELRDYLRKRKHKYVDGPVMAKVQTGVYAQFALRSTTLNLKQTYCVTALVERVFVCELALNAGNILRGKAKRGELPRPTICCRD